MTLAVLAVGLTLFATGLLSFCFPRRLRDVLVWFTAGNRLALAVVGRLAIGLLLLLGAADLRWPVAGIVLGLVFLAAGAAIPVLGEERTEHIVTWWLARSDTAVRSWCITVMLTGGFIAWLASPPIG